MTSLFPLIRMSGFCFRGKPSFLRLHRWRAANRTVRPHFQKPASWRAFCILRVFRSRFFSAGRYFIFICQGGLFRTFRRVFPDQSHPIRAATVLCIDPIRLNPVPKEHFQAFLRSRRAEERTVLNAPGVSRKADTEIKNGAGAPFEFILKRPDPGTGACPGTCEPTEPP